MHASHEFLVVKKYPFVHHMGLEWHGVRKWCKNSDFHSLFKLIYLLKYSIVPYLVNIRAQVLNYKCKYSNVLILHLSKTFCQQKLSIIFNASFITLSILMIIPDHFMISLNTQTTYPYILQGFKDMLLLNINPFFPHVHIIFSQRSLTQHHLVFSFMVFKDP